MKKKITLLTLNEEIAPLMKEELDYIFDNLFEINYYYLSHEAVPTIKNTDLILCHDPNLLVEMIPYIKCDAPTLIMKRTISNESFKKLKNLPAGKKALIISVNDYATLEILTTIYQLGINHLTLYPYRKNKSNYPPVDYIISSRDYDYIPEVNAELVIIGKREFDISIVLDIIALMDIDRITSEKIIRRHSLKVPTFWQGIKSTLKDKRILSAQWNILLDEFSDAVIVCNENNEITLTNNKAADMLSLSHDSFRVNRLEDIVNKFPELEVFLSDRELNNELIYCEGKQFVITIKKVEFDLTSHGKIIIVSLYNDMLKVQQKIHQKIIGKGYFSKYTFDDIIGQNPKLLEAIEISKKVADSSSTVLITGENGAGKELFAGAIHNYSSRNKKPFVAINCATLPESLLESELFGYEEGAFTGAKKGGKIGMFERANNGTLFLDEIGEIPIKVQARLLRALQEKEIMRVGGDSIIKVNTRIIAATNKDLFKMVESGTFREDLLFRLNVFQVDIPPLKDRSSDIPLLVDYFLSKTHDSNVVMQDFKTFSQNYEWPGNVRELFNVLEYMTTISKEGLSTKNLPKYLKRKEYFYKDKKISADMTLTEYLLLKLLKQEEECGRNTGRRSLCKVFQNIHHNISEVNIRKVIDNLADKGYLTIHRGRRGCEITAQGINLLNNGQN